MDINFKSNCRIAFVCETDEKNIQNDCSFYKCNKREKGKCVYFEDGACSNFNAWFHNCMKTATSLFYMLSNGDENLKEIKDKK